MFTPDKYTSLGEHVIELVSKDRNSILQSILKTDTINVTITEAEEETSREELAESPVTETSETNSCNLIDSALSKIKTSLTETNYAVSIQAGQVGIRVISFRDKYNAILKLVAGTGCPSPKFTVTPAYSFILLDTNSQTLTVQADESTEAKVFDDIKFNITIDVETVSVPIKVEFTECKVEKLTWLPSKIALDYVIGSGSLSKTLSSLK